MISHNLDWITLPSVQTLPQFFYIFFLYQGQIYSKYMSNMLNYNFKLIPCGRSKLKLFGMFNIHTNDSGSHWDNHQLSYYFDLRFMLPIFHIFNVRLHATEIDPQWHGTTITVIIRVTITYYYIYILLYYPGLTQAWTWILKRSAAQWPKTRFCALS